MIVTCDDDGRCDFCHWTRGVDDPYFIDQSAIGNADSLTPACPRSCIGATTLDEYRKYIEKDPALERRFQQARHAGACSCSFGL